jgi:hypothetical protein
MKCPACSTSCILIIAWPGNLQLVEPNMFAQYRCTQGHYFETLKVFNGSTYEEHYVPFGEPKRDIRACIN